MYHSFLRDHLVHLSQLFLLLLRPGLDSRNGCPSQGVESSDDESDRRGEGRHREVVQVHQFVTDGRQDPEDDHLSVQTDVEGVDQVDADAQVVGSHQPPQAESETVLHVVAEAVAEGGVFGVALPEEEVGQEEGSVGELRQEDVGLGARAEEVAPYSADDVPGDEVDPRDGQPGVGDQAVDRGDHEVGVDDGPDGEEHAGRGGADEVLVGHLAHREDPRSDEGDAEAEDACQSQGEVARRALGDSHRFHDCSLIAYQLWRGRQDFGVSNVIPGRYIITTLLQSYLAIRPRVSNLVMIVGVLRPKAFWDCLSNQDLGVQQEGSIKYMWHSYEQMCVL